MHEDDNRDDKTPDLDEFSPIIREDIQQLISAAEVMDQRLYEGVLPELFRLYLLIYRKLALESDDYHPISVSALAARYQASRPEVLKLISKLEGSGFVKAKVHRGVNYIQIVRK